MTDHCEIGSVVGPTSTTHWAQVLHLPHAYGVVEMEAAGGTAQADGIHLLSRLSDNLTDAPVSLQGLSVVASDAFYEGVQTILLCVPVGHAVYIVLRGAGDVYLKRGTSFAHLLHNDGSISGEVKEGDTIILASKEFSSAIQSHDAARVFDHLTPEEVAEKLTLELHEKSYREGAAALVVQIGSIEKEVDVDQVQTVPSSAPIIWERFHVRELRRRASTLWKHPRGRMIAITIGLSVLFVVAVLIGVWKQTTQGMSPSARATVADAKHAIDEGVALLSLNPVKGRERLTRAKSLLEPLEKTVSPRSPNGRMIADLLHQIQDNITQSMQITKVSPELFFDAGLVKKGGMISSIGFEGTSMAILDTTTQTVLALDIGTKKATVVGGGPTYGGMTATTLHGNTMYTLVSVGIHKVTLDDKKTVQAIIKRAPEWGSIAAFTSFGGNVYLLDTTTSRIWKYVATEAGFTEMREYLNPDTLPDLTQTNSMAIDGSVWLGSNNGKIWKFTGGREDTFLPQGVEPALGKTLIVYTDDSMEHMYVLDRENKRVVVLMKDGTYLAQYVWDQLSPISLAVSEAAKKIFLLSEGKLYAITIK